MLAESSDARKSGFIEKSEGELEMGKKKITLNSRLLCERERAKTRDESR